MLGTSRGQYHQHQSLLLRPVPSRTRPYQRAMLTLPLSRLIRVRRSTLTVRQNTDASAQHCITHPLSAHPPNNMLVPAHRAPSVVRKGESSVYALPRSRRPSARCSQKLRYVRLVCAIFRSVDVTHRYLVYIAKCIPTPPCLSGHCMMWYGIPH